MSLGESTKLAWATEHYNPPTNCLQVLVLRTTVSLLHVKEASVFTLHFLFPKFKKYIKTLSGRNTAIAFISGDHRTVRGPCAGSPHGHCHLQAAGGPGAS